MPGDERLNRMDTVDLHVHTSASDGSYSPKYVVSLAAMQNLKAIAITDHDTMAGIQEAGEAGELMGVTIIPGIELSTDYQGEDVHVLGYFLDPAAEDLQAYEAWVRQTRRDRIAAMIGRLQKKGFDITLEQIEAAHPDAMPGRPHLAERLVELGAVPNVKEAFRKYLSKGRSCYVPRKRIPFADAAALITKCGGVAVLAHPLQYGYNREQLDTLVRTAAQLGFKGMEIFYSGYTRADQDKLFDLAEKYSLLPTGGSDFHGTPKPEIQLGTGMNGDLAVPAYVLIMLAKSQFS